MNLLQIFKKTNINIFLTFIIKSFLLTSIISMTVLLGTITIYSGSILVQIFICALLFISFKYCKCLYLNDKIQKQKYASE